MKRLQLTSVVASFVASTFLAALAGAQANNPPLNVNVTNTPLPVTVISPPVPSTIVCTTSLGSGGQGGTEPFFSAGGLSSPIPLNCPAGVTAIDVRRIVLDFGQFLNIAGYVFTIKIGTFVLTPIPGIPSPILLAVLTNGAPEVSFAEPVRLNLASTAPPLGIGHTARLYSGLVGFGPAYSGTLYIFGQAVP